MNTGEAKAVAQVAACAKAMSVTSSPAGAETAAVMAAAAVTVVDEVPSASVPRRVSAPAAGAVWSYQMVAVATDGLSTREVLRNFTLSVFVA